MIAHVRARPAGESDGTLKAIDVSDIRAPDAKGLLWIDVDKPDDQDVAWLRQTFHLHPIALLDIGRGHQRPKLDEYDGAFFGVIFAVVASPLVTRELQFFWGPGYLITLHREQISAIDDLLGRVKIGGLGLEQRQVVLADLVYFLLDAIVDGYFPVIDALVERSEDVEEEMFSRERSPATLQSIFDVKKQLFHLRKVIAPERDVVNVLLRRDQTLFGNDFYPYFQDIYDRINRVVDGIDTYRDVLSTLLDSYLSLVSNDVNQTVKRMTAVTAILMVDALIAGIYGMNFQYIPELGWQFGYPFAVALMMAASFGLWLVFRKIKWF